MIAGHGGHLHSFRYRQQYGYPFIDGVAVYFSIELFSIEEARREASAIAAAVAGRKRLVCVGANYLCTPWAKLLCAVLPSPACALRLTISRDFGHAELACLMKKATTAAVYSS